MGSLLAERVEQAMRAFHALEATVLGPTAAGPLEDYLEVGTRALTSRSFCTIANADFADNEPSPAFKEVLLQGVPNHLDLFYFSFFLVFI
jgi:hypothetical protein